MTSGEEIKIKHRELQKLNERVQSQLKDFFSNYTLFSPLNARYDGEKYKYEIENLSGLALNPSFKQTILSELPLIDSRLYIGHIKPNDEPTKSYPLHQIVSLDEVDTGTGFKAFYFYSDFIKDEPKKDAKEDNKYMLRFVCPYPNMKMFKFKELKEMGLKQYD